MIYIDLIINLSLLVALSVVSGFIEKHWPRHTRLGVLLQGFLFGCASVIGMLRPLNMGPGLIFDGRSVMVSLCALFFGPWAASVAAMMTIACRVGLGGVGGMTGVLVIVASAVIGLVARIRLRPVTQPLSVWNLYLVGLIAAAVLLALMFTLPGNAGMGVVMRIGIPVMLLYPLATVLVGKVLSDQASAIGYVEGLRKSEEKFKLVFEAANVGKSLTLPTGEINVNQAFCDMLGYTRKELSNKRWQDITPPQDIEPTQVMLDQLLQRKKDSVRFNKRYIHKNGSTVWADVSVAMQRDINGNPLFFITTVFDVTERKQAEEKIRENERKLKEAQEMAHLGYWSWDVKTGDVEWSEEVYKIFCLDPKEFTPHIDSILALSPWPEDHQRDKELINRAIETHAPGSYEQKFLRPDNSIGYYFSTFHGNYDEKGDLVSIVGSVMDITERKIAEEKIQLAHDRLRRLVDSNIVGIVTAAADGKIIEANDYYLSMIGFTREEFEQGKIDWRSITPAEWLLADEIAIRELREKGNCTPYEKEYQRRDGTRISVFLADTILPGPEEEIVAFALDITERKRAESKLRESEAKLQLTIDEAPVCVAMVGMDKRFLQCNKSFCAFLGYSDEEMKGKTIAEITFPADVEIGMADMQAVLAGQKRSSSVQKRYVRKDGKVVWGEVAINIIRDSQGNPLYFLPIIQDITERKQAEEEILKLNDDLERKVSERTAELQKTIAQLEELNRSFVGRELKMIELKERIAELEKQKT